MKKISFALALIMILALCASTLGMTVSAADTYKETTVAIMTDKNGTVTEYDDITKAFSAYKGGETLKLLKDVEITKAISISGSAVAEDLVTMMAKEKLTVDGNGKTLKIALGRADNWGIVLTAANVEINNLNLYTVYDAIRLVGASTLVLNNTNIYSGNTQPGVDITGDHSYKGAAIKQDNDAKGYVEINGGEIKGSGTRTSETKEDGSVKYTFTSQTVVDIRYGRLVITDATVIGYNTGVLVQVGDATKVAEEDVMAAAWIYGGKYVLFSPEFNGTNSVVVRSYRGGLLSVYGGTFVNYTKANNVGGAVFGSHSAGGTYTYIFGGKFYNLSDNVNSMLIAHNAKQNSVSVMESDMFFYIYGGEFYSKVIEERVEVNMAGETNVIRNKDDYTYTETPNQLVPVLSDSEIASVNVYKYEYKYATEAKADAKIKVENPDGKTYYSNSLWQAINAIAKSGAKITLLADIELTKECIAIARDADITIDANGKKITVADGVKNALRLQRGNFTIENADIANAGGTVFSFGYSLLDLGDGTFEVLDFPNYDVSLTLKDSKIVGATDAYVTTNVNAGTLTFTNTTVNGAAPAEATVDLSTVVKPSTTPDGGTGDGTGDGTTDGEGEGNTNTDNGNNAGNNGSTDDTTKDTAPADKKGGCGGAIGAGAIAIVAVAGLACGIASKKRED